MERLLQSDTYASQDADIAALALLCRLSRSTVPYSILLGTENTPLREVGSWYRGELTLNDVALQRRWP